MEEEETAGRSGALAFAEQQLRRHGWEKGKGLGKRENGISEAIRVKVKCDTAGVGHNSAEQFSFHWWDHLFNASAASISVEAGQDGVKVQKVSERNGPVTNKKPRKAHGERDMLYGRFVKAATLTSGGEEPSNPAPSSSDSSDEDEKLDLSSARRLTDEELVQACGGRTAHKGARHGLTMSAKLARLEEQEKAFLAGHLRQKASQKETESAVEGSKQKKKKKKKRSKRPEDGDAEEAVSSEGLEAMGEEERPKKKGKRKKRRKEEEENVEEEPWTQTPEPKGQKKAKRKKK